jgi:hypothetical protein
LDLGDEFAMSSKRQPNADVRQHKSGMAHSREFLELEFHQRGFIVRGIPG